MPALFTLLHEEEKSAVRAVPGHFFFVYIHTYIDGNGRMGRLLIKYPILSIFESMGYFIPYAYINEYCSLNRVLRTEFSECFRKLSWEGMDWLLNGLRIDKESLDTITGDDIKILEMIYKHKQVKSYLSSFSRELPID